MSELGARIAAEAERLVGIPFRLHGREPATGLDCIGLVAHCLSVAHGGRTIATPTGYRLKNSGVAAFLKFAQSAGLRCATGRWELGDILHVQPGPAQDHLLIVSRSNILIHAHAALKCMVRTPASLGQPIAHHWRAI